MGRVIAGSAGTEPEQPAGGVPGSRALPAAAGTADATAAATAVTAAGGSDAGGGGAPSGLRAVSRASITVRDGAAFVAVDGRVGRLSPADAARLGTLAPAAPRQEALGGDLRPAIEAARANEAALLALPGVVAVRAGFKFVDGWITPTPAVIVAVDRKRDDIAPSAAIPAVLPDGTPTDVAIADPVDLLRRGGATGPEAVPVPAHLIEQVQGDAEGLLEAVRPITYRPPDGATLDPVTGPMAITCHVSPDAGWAVLRPFLAATRTAMALGMYDFTAPHIYRAVRAVLLGSSVTWRATLDPGEDLPHAEDTDSTKAEDKPEAWINAGLARAAGGRFETAFARTGSGRTFASAYHLKLAVRDDEATWLSSGNWQSSNQPAIDFLAPDADLRLIAAYNREWHAVVESPELATRFRAYLDGDFATAGRALESAVEREPSGPDLLLLEDEVPELAARSIEAFPPHRFVFTAEAPLTVQPILTPDNYLDVVLPLLRERPGERLYVQNQSLNPVLTPTARWSELIGLLAERSRDDALDVRIIIREIGDARKKLESLQLAGFDMRRVRVQRGCHTKGIVIDGATVLLGSHNGTNEGVEANRDASLLIRDAGIAGYYERVFLHDWDNLARQRIVETPAPVPMTPGSEAAALAASHGRGRVIPWAAWIGD